MNRSEAVTAGPPKGAPAEPPVARDARLWALALGNFAMGTGAMMMAGLLPLLSADLAVSVPAAGQSVTAFAIAVALGGPLLAGPTSRVPRRRLLCLALGLFILASLAGAFSSDYVMLLASRVAAGIGACLFTPHASGTAAAMVSADRRGRAISLVFVGFTMASVLGVPLGMLVGQWLGWRMSLVAVAGVGAVALAVLWRALPADLRTPTIDVAGWRALINSPSVLGIIGVNSVQILGQMMVFSYIAPLMAGLAGIEGGALGLFMAAFGAAGVAGNLICGRIIDRIGPARTAHLALGTMVVGFCAWLALVGTPAAAPVLCLFWGLGAFAVNTAQQTRLVAAAPTLVGASLPLNSSAIYVGQGIGAAFGGALVGGVGVAVLPVFSLVLVAGALAASMLSSRRLAKR
jgi:predicted MFS family arabinose efflux permease